MYFQGMQVGHNTSKCAFTTKFNNYDHLESFVPTPSGKWPSQCLKEDIAIYRE